PFLQVLADLTGWLEHASVPSMIIGGVAVAVLGRPRATRDVDTLALMPEDRWASVLSVAKRHGIEARIDKPLDFARRTHVLLVRHIATGIDIDVLLGRLPYQEDAVGRGKIHNLGGVRVRLPQVEDLLIMKAVAQRPQDVRDIEGLLDLHPKADIETVRQWVREFSTAMTMPDLFEGFEKLLTQRKYMSSAPSKPGQRYDLRSKSKYRSGKKSKPKR
ncbi:MAG: nucleotidyltransferase, partial [Proteobacteria bacterium]|nr:nucleotidyltransferase [Pseudomonadota bacterium]